MRWILPLLCISCAVVALAAPRPLERRATRRLDVHSLAGPWTLRWGVHDYRIHLHRGGAYQCDGSAHPRGFVGSWAVMEGNRLVITETSRPEVSDAWSTYILRLDPATLRGHVEQGSVAQFEVSLRRPID